MGAWLGGASYLQKWLFLGILIGLIAGGGAAGFYYILSHATHLLIADVGGYSPPSTANEDTAHMVTRTFGDYSRPWAVPLVVCGGALLSGFLVVRYAPSAEGHGTDAAIEAIHHNPRKIRVRTVIVKIVASALMIGSGGSGGREGPTAQISAGFGSLLTRYFDLRDADGRIALSVGLGAGIGAIFSAPLGGAVLAASLAYKNDFDNRVLIPGFITSITAYSVFGAFLGYEPIFGFAARDYVFDDPAHLAWFAVIGVLAGVVGIAYSMCFWGMKRLLDNAAGPRQWRRIARTGVGGLLVGLLALGIPQVLGSGYGWAQQSLGREELMAMPLWIVLLLPAAKIAATVFSVGSGGSGGLFGPGIVIGAFTGAAVWRIGDIVGLSGVPDSPAPFVIVGMMACFGSISRAPLAVMLMVAEMTGSYTILMPAMVAVGLAYLIVRQSGKTMFIAQVNSREEEYAARVGSGLPLLNRISVAETMSEPRLILAGSGSWRDAVSAMTTARVRGAPVVDGEGRFVGVVRLRGLGVGGLRVWGDECADSSDGDVLSHADIAAPTLSNVSMLDTALDPLRAGGGWAPVVGADRRVRGIVGAREIVRAYRSAMQHERERFRTVAPHAGIIDVTVTDASSLVGRPIGDPALPRGAIVLAVVRDGVLLRGGPSVAFEPGDVVTVLGDTDDIDRARAGIAE